MPWQISTVHPQSLSFQGFWSRELVSKCPDRTLSQVYVGKAKDSLDLVDLNLVILEVAAVFGRFVKYTCTVDQSQEETDMTS